MSLRERATMIRANREASSPSRSYSRSRSPARGTLASLDHSARRSSFGDRTAASVSMVSRRDSLGGRRDSIGGRSALSNNGNSTRRASVSFSSRAESPARQAVRRAQEMKEKRVAGSPRRAGGRSPRRASSRFDEIGNRMNSSVRTQAMDVLRGGSMTAADLSRAASPGRSAKNPQELVAFLRAKRSASKSTRDDEALDVLGEHTKVVAAEVRALFENNNVDVVSAFRGFDEDGNGKVDKTEFRRGLHGLHIGLTDPQIDSLLSMVDKNGDGEIDYLEFAENIGGMSHKAALSASLAKNAEDADTKHKAEMAVKQEAEMRRLQASPPPVSVAPTDPYAPTVRQVGAPQGAHNVNRVDDWMTQMQQQQLQLQPQQQGGAPNGVWTTPAKANAAMDAALTQHSMMMENQVMMQHRANADGQLALMHRVLQQQPPPVRLLYSHPARPHTY